jgi:hypothetical protein
VWTIVSTTAWLILHGILWLGFVVIVTIAAAVLIMR